MHGCADERITPEREDSATGVAPIDVIEVAMSEDIHRFSVRLTHQWVDVNHGLGRFMRFYHNPRCSKSRQALALLNDRGVAVDVVRYLEVGVVEEDLPLLASLEGIVRKKEAGAHIIATLETEDDVVALLRSNPRVLERPVLVVEGKAVIGRPPEDVLSLLD